MKVTKSLDFLWIWKKVSKKWPIPLLLMTIFCFSAPTVFADESDFGGKRVAAYYADWEYYYNSLFTPDNVDFSRMTHVNYAFAWVDEEGTIYFTDQYTFYGIGEKSFSGGAGSGEYKCSPPFWHPFSTYDNSKHDPICQSWNDDNAGFAKSVHDAGAKAILSIGGWTLSHKVSEMLEIPTARENFINNAVQFLEDWNFDGIDLDFEYPGYAPNGGRSIDKENFTLLLQEMRARFDELKSSGHDYELTAAVSCGQQIADNGYDYEQVVDLLDYVNLMSYDFGGDWDSVAQHVAPLYPYPGQVNDGFDADSCVDLWMTSANAPAERFVLGVAHYGRSLQGASAIGDASGGHDSAHWGNDTETRYYQIYEKQNTDSSFHTAYDSDAQTEYGWFDGGGFISFDGPTSVAKKAQYVLDMGLSGIMIWQLNGGIITENNVLEYPLLDASINVLKGGSGDDGSGDDGSGDDGATGSCAGAEEFVQPYAGDDPYTVGDLVIYNGTVYKSTFATNWWSPQAAPQYWEEVSCDDSGDGGDDSGDDTGDDSSSCSEIESFVQPYAGDAPYTVGDRVIFNDKAYESTFSPNWWSPAAAPQYWEEISCN